MTQLFAVAGGGAVGAGLRFALCDMTQRLLGRDLPYDTLLVNILGAFLIGVLAGGDALPAWLHTGMIVGVLGRFTTFSAFSWETMSLASAGMSARAATNVFANVFLSLTAGWAGLALRMAVH